MNDEVNISPEIDLVTKTNAEKEQKRKIYKFLNLINCMGVKPLLVSIFPPSF